LRFIPFQSGGKRILPGWFSRLLPGNAINVSVIDLGNRFRMIVNEVEVVKCPDMPKLPVASVLWKPLPDLKNRCCCMDSGRRCPSHRI
jgi:L-arabinose isomerase